LSEAER